MTNTKVIVLVYPTKMILLEKDAVMLRGKSLTDTKHYL